MKNRIERYYDGTLDDVSIMSGDKEIDRSKVVITGGGYTIHYKDNNGLPDTKDGIVTGLVSMPGRIYASLDAGSSGYSAVYLRRGGGWHNIYQAPSGKRINSLFVQSIDGLDWQYLWVGQDNDMLYLPVIVGNPYDYETSDIFTPFGYLTTGWFDDDKITLKKLFNKVTIFSDNVNADVNNVTLEYQTDDDTSWTIATLAADSDTLNYTATLNVKAYRLRLRIGVQGVSGSQPRITGLTIDYIVRYPVKHAYTLRFLISDAERDLTGYSEYELTSDKISTLDTWGDAPTALTMNSLYAPFDGKTVLLEEGGVQPFKFRTTSGKELLLGEISLLEI
jgi:hypothetical protein